MNKIFKELKKVITDKTFIITCLPCIILSIIHALYKISYYLQYCNAIDEYTNNDTVYNPHWAIYSIYQLWIGCDISSDFPLIMSYLFFIQISVFCMLSCNSTIKTKHTYLKHKYISFSDYIVAFISFGMFEFIPLLLNFFLLSLFIPIVQPDSIYDIYYNFFAKDFMANLFYSTSFFYILFFVMLNFIMFGLIGCISVSIFKKYNKFTILIIFPELMIILLDITKNIWQNFIFKNSEISPISFLMPVNSHQTNLAIIICELMILLLINFFIKRKEKK